MTRSMSDDQILAKYGHDKQPWIDPLSGSRWAVRSFTFDTLDPRPECIPSPDPLPWAWGDDWGVANRFTTFAACDEDHEVNQSSTSDFGDWQSYNPRPWGSFTPDPEFVRSPVNPILSAFRDALRSEHIGQATPRYLRCLADYPASNDPIANVQRVEVDYSSFVTATAEQVDSARVILERLARVIDNSTSTK